MTDKSTNFPPQTYSSSFYLNSVTEDEKSVRECKRNNFNSKTPLFDCFVSTMQCNQIVIYLFLIILTIKKANCGCDRSIIYCLHRGPTITFASMEEYRRNTISFHYDDDKFRGDYITFEWLQVYELKKDTFCHNNLSDGVVGLFLSGKQVLSIEAGTFNCMTCLGVLDLSNNLIAALPSHLFEKTLKLREINLSNNRLTRIADYTFTLNYLQELDLSNNDLEYYEKSAFALSPCLFRLDLHNNTRLRLHAWYELGIDPVVYLDVSHCNLHDMPEDASYGLPYVKVFNASFNHFSVLPPDMHSVEELNLRGNDIDFSTINPPILHDWDDLKILDIRGNYFGSCERWWEIEEFLKYKKIISFEDPKCTAKRLAEDALQRKQIGSFAALFVGIIFLLIAFTAYLKRRKEKKDRREIQQEAADREEWGTRHREVTEEVEISET